MQPTKICPITGQEFQPVKAQKYSKEGAKIAHKRQNQKFQADNKEYMREYRAKWRSENEDYIRAYAKTKRDKVKDDPKYRAEQAKLSRERRQADPEAYRAYINNYFSERPVVIDGVEYQGYRQTPKYLDYSKSFQSEYYRNRMSKRPLNEVKRKELLEFQGNRCAICYQHLDSPQEDHDPILGHTRGFLCVSCNTGLGYLQDNSLMARKLVEAQVIGKLKRNAQINRILGRFGTIEKLLAAADFLENPTYNQCFKSNENEPQAVQVSV